MSSQVILSNVDLERCKMESKVSVGPDSRRRVYVVLCRRWRCGSLLPPWDRSDRSLYSERNWAVVRVNAEWRGYLVAAIAANIHHIRASWSFRRGFA